MPKRKCKFTEELRAKYPCFRVGRERWEAECLVCREGTYVSVANKGSLDLEAHVQSRKHKRNVGAAPEPPGCFQPFHGAPQSSLAFPALRDSCDPDPAGLALPVKMEAPLETPYGDPLDGIPFCGVALGAGDAGTPFPMRIRYFDWKSGGLQTWTLAAEPEPPWDILERRGLAQKCVAVVGAGHDLMLGGPEAPECGVPGLRKLLRGALVASECPARILSNCLQHGADGLELDVQSALWKIYAYASAYSVRAPEPLRDFWEFAEREYGRLQRHGRTPWLPLLPALSRLLQAFPALKSFFLSLRSPPVAIRRFLEDDFSEIYVQHLASQAALFQSHLRMLAREDNSLSEVLAVLSSLRRSLRERRARNFMSLRVKELLAEQRAAGRAERAESFCRHARGLYVAFGDYLDARTGSLEALSCFRWMQLRMPPAWEDVEGCVKFLAARGVPVDDGKCFDEFCRLLAFLRDCGSDFGALQTARKWARFLGSARGPGGHPELLRMAQVFFAVPACGADFSKEVLQG